MTDEPDILFDRQGALGRIVLNRPKALNALTLDMCLAIKARLDEWVRDDAVEHVAITSGGGRAFCAGGDIRALYDSGKAGTPYALDFWSNEYRLNAAIKRFPKPYVAILDGIVMGGGVGVSVHGSHRVATENVVFAMPETGIGLFPDVGATYFLSRCPGRLGLYLALTGARLQTADLINIGIATHFVASDQTATLLSRLADGEPPASAIAALAETVGPGPLAEHCDALTRGFGGPSVEAILHALGNEGTWGDETAAALRTKSPTSLKIAQRQMREGVRLGFEDCMRLEFRIVSRVIAGHDFFEGVRAAVIDKDQKPKWQPAALADVSDEDVARYFAPLGAMELTLP